jgi:hypothetical protein
MRSWSGDSRSLRKSSTGSRLSCSTRREKAHWRRRALTPSRVTTTVAVSCNPSTFARDAPILLDGDYQLTQVTRSQVHQLKRRQFITTLGGTAVWPLTARAQQPERMRRIGVLMGAANDSEGQARARTFEQGLDRLGWMIGRISVDAEAGPKHKVEMTPVGPSSCSCSPPLPGNGYRLEV